MDIDVIVWCAMLYPDWLFRNLQLATVVLLVLVVANNRLYCSNARGVFSFLGVDAVLGLIKLSGGPTVSNSDAVTTTCYAPI